MQPPIRILILSDGRPGHFHLADGVAAAVARRAPVEITHLDIRRGKLTPARTLALALRFGAPAASILKLAFGVPPARLPSADLVISAGGDTLAANVAAARLLGARNIFCGTLRHFGPTDFSLVVSSYARHAALDRHLIALKPNGLDPDTLPPRTTATTATPVGAPKLAGLLVGGPSGLFSWRDEEWARLIGFLGAAHRDLSTRWIVSTSRRTPEPVADRLAVLARMPDGPIAELIDFRSAGSGTLPALFARVEAVLVTEDSSTMMSEAVCARLPVVGVAPATHDFKDEEREYRRLMTDAGWCRSVPLARLVPDTFLAALSEVRPLEENHLDRLAAALAERLPELFASVEEPRGP